MKFVLFAALLAVCTASTLYRGKNISVNDDGSIYISYPSGKRVIITRPVGVNGRKNIDITVAGPNIPTRRIQIDDEKNLYDAEYRESGRAPWSSVDSVEEGYRPKRSSKKDKSQGDVLCEILREYQGPIDEPLYEKLLGKIEKACKKGEISRQIYDLLVGFEQGEETGVVSDIDSRRGFGYGYGQSVLPRSPLYWYNREIPQSQTVYGRQVQPEQVGLYGDNVYSMRRAQEFGSSRYVNPLLEGIYYRPYQYQQYRPYQYQQYQPYQYQYQQYQPSQYQQYQQYEPSQVDDLLVRQGGVSRVFPKGLYDIIYNVPWKQVQSQRVSGDEVLLDEYLRGRQQYEQQVPYSQRQPVGEWSRILGRPNVYEGVQGGYRVGQGQPIIQQNSGVYRESLRVPQVGY